MVAETGLADVREQGTSHLRGNPEIGEWVIEVWNRRNSRDACIPPQKFVRRTAYSSLERARTPVGRWNDVASLTGGNSCWHSNQEG
jgi:hypothetical protein